MKCENCKKRKVDHICVNCGKYFVSTGKRKIPFCSQKCRRKWIK